MSSHFGFRRIPQNAVLERVNGGQRWRWGDQVRGYNKKTGKRIVMLWTRMVIVEVMRRGGIWVYLEDTAHFLMDYMWDVRGREESERLQLSSRALLLFKTGGYQR